jgi:hypothetical protein
MAAEQPEAIIQAIVTGRRRVINPPNRLQVIFCFERFFGEKEWYCELSKSG